MLCPFGTAVVHAACRVGRRRGLCLPAGLKKQVAQLEPAAGLGKGGGFHALKRFSAAPCAWEPLCHPAMAGSAPAGSMGPSLSGQGSHLRGPSPSMEAGELRTDFLAFVLLVLSCFPGPQRWLGPSRFIFLPLPVRPRMRNGCENISPGQAVHAVRSPVRQSP